MREWLGADHRAVKKALGDMSPDMLAERMISQTRLGDIAVRHMLWDRPDLVMTSTDPCIKLAIAVDDEARVARHRFYNEVEGTTQRAGQAIAEARFAMTGTDIYPDATYNLRLSYGEVKGWQEGEEFVRPYTYVAGAFSRHTGAEPFALPYSWMKAKSLIAIGTPYDYVTTHDSVGGNSGSAIINRDAELVGLVFDGNIHSLGGTFGYDESINRAVALHPAMLLQALKYIYKADALLMEINAKE